jgi:RHS repeat-associated protein
LRSATARVALPVPTIVEKAAEGFFDNSDRPVIFAYDGYGRRIKIAEFDNGNLTSKKLYWWLGGEIVCERDGIDPGFPITKRYFGQGVVVGAERLYYTMDQLGSVRELVDSSGVVRADYRYTPYGERTKVGGDLDADWGYAGLFHHGPSGLDLATYRTYDSKMGRWISRDPLGEGVDYNLYRYCGNNPISYVDPVGLDSAPPGMDPIEFRKGRNKPSEVKGVCARQTLEVTATLLAAYFTVYEVTLAAFDIGYYYQMTRGAGRNPSPPSIPTLTPGPGGRMLGEAGRVLANTPPAQRADVARRLIDQVNRTNTSDWHGQSIPAANGASAWSGETHTLVVDANGLMFQGPNSGTSAGLLPGGGVGLTDWSGLRPWP